MRVDDIFASHWTKFGTITPIRDVICGSWCRRLVVNGRKTETIFFYNDEIEQIAQGKLDHVIGFSAKDAGIPVDFKNWNNLS